ncbi:hypothetical protein [Yinghuangia sp. YIM S10712]|uniref:hypothetical protein n=1 Tax=Yinghuangia sp. YIM S10712 TaxID=3436930 RepID=UPI003F52A995
MASCPDTGADCRRRATAGHALDEIDKARTIRAAIERGHRDRLGQPAYEAFKTVLRHIARDQRTWRET